MELIKSKKHQNILVGILIIAIIVTIVFWYVNYQKEPFINNADNQEKSFNVSANEEMLKKITIDFNVLDNDLFKSLKSHGLLPVIAGETGRENPFISY